MALPTPHPLSAPSTPSRILFVDDEVRVVNAMRRMIEDSDADWTCGFATNGEEAWALLSSEPFDAVVSDMNMPGWSGLDLLKQIRSSEMWSIPFLMLTGNGCTALKRRALEAGATDFLNKPCDFQELTARLTNVLAIKAYQDAIRLHSEELEARVRERTAELTRSRRSIIMQLSKAAEMRDSDTGEHILRVGRTARILGEQLGLSETEQEDLQLASYLHDVGKIAISDTILLKPGPLSREERAVMQRHCELGFQILQPENHLDEFGAEADSVSNDLLHLAATIAMNHHEHWDGSGYPHRLSGELIPFAARIVAVADVYDALRSRRPYKEPMSIDQSVDFIQSRSGSQFDPAVVSEFLKAVPRIEAVTRGIGGEASDISRAA